jgi:SAM-dependent methyltransferase
MGERFVEATDLLDRMIEVRDRDVLDVGCGEGWLVRRLGEHGARAVGVDPLAVALERARAQEPDAPGERYLEAGAEELPLPDRSFDAVVFFNSLHHVPEDRMDAALAEAARVLRSGGLLYVQEPVAEGEFFELGRPVEDETHVRAAAQAALGRALGGGALEEVSRRELMLTIRLESFEAWRRMMTGVDPTRGPAVDALEESLRAAFDRFGHPAPAGGRAFHQPVSVAVARRGDGVG